MTAGDSNGQPLEVVLQQMADWLADEREQGRQRMRALGMDESEIAAVLGYAERMHAAQIAWLESVASQHAGLATLQ